MSLLIIHLLYFHNVSVGTQLMNLPQFPFRVGPSTVTHQASTRYFLVKLLRKFNISLHDIIYACVRACIHACLHVCLFLGQSKHIPTGLYPRGHGCSIQFFFILSWLVNLIVSRQDLCSKLVVSRRTGDNIPLRWLMVKQFMKCGKGAIQVLRNADGGGGCQILRKKALRRCNVQCY